MESIPPSWVDHRPMPTDNEVRDQVITWLVNNSTCINCFTFFYHQLILLTGHRILLSPVHIERIHLMYRGYKIFHTTFFINRPLTSDNYENGRRAFVESVRHFFEDNGLTINHSIHRTSKIFYDTVNYYMSSCFPCNQQNVANRLTTVRI